MKMQFSKNKYVRQHKYYQQHSVSFINETYKQPMQPILLSQRRNYDMVSIANSGSKCNFCNR